MDDWLRDLQEILNSTAQNSSQWLGNLSKEAEQAVDKWLEASEENFQEIQAALDPALSEISDSLEEMLDASTLFVDQQLTPWLEEVTAPISCTVNPWLQNHPTCIGCKHYHGATYGDSMLVCGMHPYGPEDTFCSDKESIWPVPPE